MPSAMLKKLWSTDAGLSIMSIVVVVMMFIGAPLVEMDVLGPVLFDVLFSRDHKGYDAGRNRSPDQHGNYDPYRFGDISRCPWHPVRLRPRDTQ